MSYYSNTPLNVSGFSGFVSQEFDERDVVDITSAWQAFWAPSQPQYARDANTFYVDTVKGNREISRLIRRGQAKGRNLDQKKKVDGKSTNTVRILPLVEEESPIGANELNFRQIGEQIGNPLTQMERLREKMMSHYKENTRKGMRTNELLSAQMIQTGKQAYILGDSTDVIDYGRAAGNSIACTDEWDDTGAVPLVDLKNGCEQGLTASGMPPEMAIFSPEAATAFFTESSIQTMADVKGFSFVMAGNLPVPPQYQRFIDGGFVYLGKITIPAGFTLYCFVDHTSYTDGGTSTPYMTAKTTVLANPRARYDLIVGPGEKFRITSAERDLLDDLGIALESSDGRVRVASHAIRPGYFDHDFYFSPDRRILQCRTQSSIVFGMPHVNTAVVLTGCAL